MSAAESVKAATTIIASSMRVGPPRTSSPEQFARETIQKLKQSNVLEKNELQRLNAQLQGYLDNVRSLEALNKRLIDEVDRVRTGSQPKIMDKTSLDGRLQETRQMLEDASLGAVKLQTSIEKNEALARHITNRL